MPSPVMGSAYARFIANVLQVYCRPASAMQSIQNGWYIVGEMDDS
jgi:hypothetical protein